MSRGCRQSGWKGVEGVTAARFAGTNTVDGLLHTGPAWEAEGAASLPPFPSLSLSLGVYLYTEGGGTRGNEWPTYFIIDSDKFRSSIMTCKH